MQNIVLNVDDLNKIAISSKELATNFPDITYDCYGLEGAKPKTKIMDKFPAVARLLKTPLSNLMRENARRGMIGMHKDSDGVWQLEVPRTVWTELPTDTSGACCWQPFDFAKCTDTVPVNILCLKDCNNILDQLIYENKYIDSKTAFDRIAGKGETYNDVKIRIARMSMAFMTAKNVFLGADNMTTPTLKPFHGFLQLIENSAVVKIYGCDVLSAFDKLGCRFSILGDGDWFYMTNPLTYRSILHNIKKDERGDYPEGWTREGDVIKYNGYEFIQDYNVPVDVETGTGEVWGCDGNYVGIYLATELMPTEKYQRHTGLKQSSEGDCGSECDYYYNYGSSMCQNANRMFAITDIPIRSACMSAISDLAGLINPETLIPVGPIEVSDTTLSALSITGATLTPTFDKEVKYYSAITTDIANVVSATATDADAEVSIRVNGAEVASGSSVTWDNGANEVIIKVTNGSRNSKYTILVTKA